MIIKQLTLATLDTGTLDFGFVGENEHINFVIKCDSVFDEYPTATASLLIKAPDNTIYPKTVEVEGYNVGWVITASDTAYPGSGQIQLTFTEYGAVVKTVIANTNVKDSLVGDDPPPDPIADWISNANQILNKVDGMTATAESLPSGDNPSVTVETVDGHYNLEFGIPAGDPGDPTEIIDDNAGVGDTTKVWSANKSATDISELKSAIDSKAPVINQTASGDIVSFTDGADNMPLSECVVSVDPVQDLHGQDAPYPAGGGKNLCVPIQNATFGQVTTSTDSLGVTTITGTASQGGGRLNLCSPPFTLPAGTYTLSHNGTGTWGYSLVVSVVGGSALAECRNSTQYNPFTLNEATTVVCGISIEVGVTYNGTVSPQIEIGSGKSSYAPYSNICPISGHTETTITRTGKNIWGGLDFANVFTDNQSTAVIDTTAKTVTHPYIAGTANQFTCFDRFKPNTVYTIILTATSQYKKANLFVSYTDGTISYFPDFTTTDKSVSIVTTDSSKSVKRIRTTNQQGDTTFYYEECGVFEGSLTAADFVPYQGQTYPITFPDSAGTVYGGTVDLAAKTLTVDRAMVDMGTFNWQKSTASNQTVFRTLAIPNVLHADSVKCVCSNYKPQGTALNDNVIVVGYTGYYANYVMIRDDSKSEYDAADFKTAMSGVQFVYELATPLVYSLTDLPTITVLKESNILADTGAISLTYPADTKTYVDDSIPSVPVQDVQINGTSILSDGVANVPIASASDFGAVKIDGNGIEISTQGKLLIRSATDSQIKSANASYNSIVPTKQHQSTFYGLAKAAGADMASSSNPVGTYTDTAKDKIMKMIGILDMIAPYESTGVATRAYGVGDCFIQGGHLYRATASISIGVSFSASNCEQTTLMAEITR